MGAHMPKDKTKLASIGSHTDVYHANDRWVCRICHASARDRSILEEIPCKRSALDGADAGPPTRVKTSITNLGPPMAEWADEPTMADPTGTYEPYAPDIGAVWYERASRDRNAPLVPWVYVDGRGWVHPTSGVLRHPVGSTLPMSSNDFHPAVKELGATLHVSEEMLRFGRAKKIRDEILDQLNRNLEETYRREDLFPVDTVQFSETEESDFGSGRRYTARVHAIPTPGEYPGK